MRRSSTNIDTLAIRTLKKKNLTEILAKDKSNANKIFTKSISNNQLNNCEANQTDDLSVRNIIFFLILVFCFTAFLFYYKKNYDR